MSLRGSGLILIVLCAALAVSADWEPSLPLAGAWIVPAALLLIGLSYEGWALSRVAVTLRIDASMSCHLGRSCGFDFTLANQAARPLLVGLSPAAPEFVEMEFEPFTLMLAAFGERTLRRAVTGARLGSHAWPGWRARVAGPLGLAWWPRSLNSGAVVNVVPDLFRSVGEMRAIAESGPAPAAEAGAGAELLRLREYRAGDPPRLVDWKATARSGRLVSRDVSQDRGLQIMLLVDAGRSSGLRAGALDRFGHYVNVAARLAQFAVERDDLVGLVLYADQPMAALAPARGAPAVARLRAVLGAGQIQRTESNPVYAMTRVKSLVRHRSLIILLTDFDDATTHSQLAQAVRLLLPKHLPFVAGLSSAAAEAMALAPAAAWLDPYRALAAQEYCSSLQRKVAALKAMGAPAVVARPEQLESAVFGAYQSFTRLRRA